MKKINFIKVATLVIVVIFSGIIFQSCQETKPLSQSDLEGYWVLKNINGEDAKSKFAGALPTLEFNFQDSIIYGTGGCNRYTGAYAYKKGVFSAPNLAVTQMLCTEPNEEGQFLLELTNVNNKLSIVNDLLTISHDGKVVLEFEKGEAPQNIETLNLDAESLSGVWLLKNIDGVNATDKFKGEGAVLPTLSFDFAENKVTGNAGCNNYNATFALNNNQLEIGPIMTTRMACPNLEGEAQFTQAIADSSTMSLPNANILQLAKNGIVILEFEKTPETSTQEDI